jgi:hypothetical protein
VQKDLRLPKVSKESKDPWHRQELRVIKDQSGLRDSKVIKEPQVLVDRMETKVLRVTHHKDLREYLVLRLRDQKVLLDLRLKDHKVHKE